jgi:hypothetical protein
MILVLAEFDQESAKIGQLTNFMTVVPVPWELVLPHPAAMPLSFLPSVGNHNRGRYYDHCFRQIAFS